MNFRPITRTLFVAGLRAFSSVGILGSIGAFLIAASATLYLIDRIENVEGRPAIPTAAKETVHQSQPPATDGRKLTWSIDSADVLRSVKDLALSHELGWAKADYHYYRANSVSPGRVEVSFAFKATYPKIRRFLFDLMKLGHPIDVNELSFSRESTADATVEGKMVFELALSRDAPTENRSEPRATQ